jgi:hypothetical protein
VLLLYVLLLLMGRIEPSVPTWIHTTPFIGNVNRKRVTYPNKLSAYSL